MIAQVRQGGGRYPLPYVEAVKAAGGHPRVFSTLPIPPEHLPEGHSAVTDIDPHDATPLSGATGLLVPGGGDIDPVWYEKDRHAHTRNVSHRRDRFEITILAEALERDMPVLGICHGMQLLNVYLGGTLVQHLADDPRCLDHDRHMPTADPVHDLRIKPGSKLNEVMGVIDTRINSHHHQGLSAVPTVLEQVGWAEDGVLEAVESKVHSWVIGVQWHPEAMAPVDECERNLFGAFVTACHDYQLGELHSEAQSA